VLANQEQQVIGYYALASASIVSNEASRKIKRNMPDPIPAMILGRISNWSKISRQNILP